jgi:hypothetical protein
VRVDLRVDVERAAIAPAPPLLAAHGRDAELHRVHEPAGARPVRVVDDESLLHLARLYPRLGKIGVVIGENQQHRRDHIPAQDVHQVFIVGGLRA